MHHPRECLFEPNPDGQLEPRKIWSNEYHAAQTLAFPGNLTFSLFSSVSKRNTISCSRGRSLITSNAEISQASVQWSAWCGVGTAVLTWNTYPTLLSSLVLFYLKVLKECVLFFSCFCLDFLHLQKCIMSLTQARCFPSPCLTRLVLYLCLVLKSLLNKHTKNKEVRI